MAGRGHGTSTFDESKLDDEIAFLKTEIYLRDVEPRLQTLTAFDRFSVRA
jgi:DNA polymerase III subunit epsilon